MTTKQLQLQLLNNNKQAAAAAAAARGSTTIETIAANARDIGDTSKRSRTQLTNGQVNAMQATFDLYRSPSLAECEILGSGIGLARRVVQVRFEKFKILILKPCRPDNLLN